MTVAIVASRLHQSLNFALGEVFAGAIVGVRQPTPGNCSLFDGWCFGSRCWFHCAISPFQAQAPVGASLTAKDSLASADVMAAH
jgi:hypothetical protein